jgi:hypothetical protein
MSPGIYHATWGLALRVVVLSELPRTRGTLLLRLLGKDRIFHDALVDLARLPEDAWERSIAIPLLVQFQLNRIEHATTEEDDVSTQFRSWGEEYRHKLRDEGRSEGRNEGRSEGERSLLLRLLRVRFGELPPVAVARVEAASMVDIERWGERLFSARTLEEVLDEPGHHEPS